MSIKRFLLFLYPVITCLYLSLLLISFNGCGHSLSDSSRETDQSVEYALITETGSRYLKVAFRCAAPDYGVVRFFPEDPGLLRVSLFMSDDHSFRIGDLKANTPYALRAGCGLENTTGVPLIAHTKPEEEADPKARPQGEDDSFDDDDSETDEEEIEKPKPDSSMLYDTDDQTKDAIPQNVLERSLWILGGMTWGGILEDSVHIFDPVDEKLYVNVTRIPTPRMYAGIIAMSGKIYVIGGIDPYGNTVDTVDTVEELDPETMKWKEMTPMPQKLQGFVTGKSGDAVYLLAGSTIANFTAGTLLDQVYIFHPYPGTSGTWESIISGDTIPPNVDMAGCSLDGVIYFGTGRYYYNGQKQFVNEGYIPVSNTLTALSEGSYGVARHGASAACYNPSVDDPYPSDPPMIIMAGGSSQDSTNQPVASITPLNVVEFYEPGNPANAVVTRYNLPAALYMPGMGISYETRKAYLFGGAIAVNVPDDAVYSLDLANPTGNLWVTETYALPEPRFGLRVVRIDR